MRRLLTQILSLFIFYLTYLGQAYAIDLYDPSEYSLLISLVKQYEQTAKRLVSTINEISKETDGMKRPLAAIEQVQILRLTDELIHLDLQLNYNFLGPINKTRPLKNVNFNASYNVEILANNIVQLYVAYIRYKTIIETISPLFTKLKTRLILRELQSVSDITIYYNPRTQKRVNNDLTLQKANLFFDNFETQTIHIKKGAKVTDILYEVSSFEYVIALGHKLDELSRALEIVNIDELFFEDLITELSNARLDIGPINLLDKYNEYAEAQDNVNPYQIMGGSDPIINAAIGFSNWISGLFGNFVGRFQSRKGYMHNNQGAIDEMQRTLKPLDILIEKTPFALTDQFIPGHFGHAALYLGTEEDLREIKLWELLPLDLKENIKKGFTIIEAVRPRVQMTTLEHFMNVDEVAVIRIDRQDIVNILDSTPFRVLQVAYEQLGKKYDFTFNAELGQTLVCSELIYRAFETVRWPTERTLGRNTISPDNIVEIVFQEGSPFHIVKHLRAESRDKIFEVPLRELEKLIIDSKNRSKSQINIVNSFIADLDY